MPEDIRDQESHEQGQEPIQQQTAANERGQEPQAEPQEGEGQKEKKVFSEEYVRTLRQENAERRQRIKKLQQAIEEMRNLSQQEREALESKLAELEAKALEAEQRYVEALLRSEVATLAAQKGLDPELAWRLLDPTEVEWDEETGKPKNVGEVLDALLQKWPFLAGQGGTTSAMNPQKRNLVFRRSQLRDPAFWQAHREEILRAMREGRIIDDLET